MCSSTYPALPSGGSISIAFRHAVDGQLLPIPINLETVNRLYGVNLTAFELPAFFERLSEKRPDDQDL